MRAPARPPRACYSDCPSRGGSIQSDNLEVAAADYKYAPRHVHTRADGGATGQRQQFAGVGVEAWRRRWTSAAARGAGPTSAHRRRRRRRCARERERERGRGAARSAALRRGAPGAPSRAPLSRRATPCGVWLGTCSPGGAGVAPPRGNRRPPSTAACFKGSGRLRRLGSLAHIPGVWSRAEGVADRSRD